MELSTWLLLVFGHCARLKQLSCILSLAICARCAEVTIVYVMEREVQHGCMVGRSVTGGFDSSVSFEANARALPNESQDAFAQLQEQISC